MRTFINRFQNGKIKHFLRPVQIITGKYAIETRNYNKPDFVVNMNYPLFDTLEDAENYLSIVFKEEAAQ